MVLCLALSPWLVGCAGSASPIGGSSGDMRLNSCLHCVSSCCDGRCVDTMGSDPENCGGCGTVCPGDMVCDAGVCRCPGNRQFCSDRCTDTNSDPTNCGGCGLRCSNNHVANPTCSNRLCNGACNAGYADCDGEKLFDGCETNVLTDNANCGACGMACSGAGRTCQNGVCR